MVATVFVVDDDESVRQLIERLVQSLALEYRSFATAESFLTHYDPNECGCLLLDMRLAGMSGLELQDRLAAQGRSIPIIVLTGYADVSTAVRAMRAKAVDVLEKPFDHQVLLDRIRTAIELDERTRRQESRRTHVLKQFQSLRPRERQVFELVVAGMPNKRIAARFNRSEKTIEYQRGNVMRKMGASCLADLVRMAIEAGLPVGNDVDRV
jgi:FixJ family two-component response regulator